MMKMSIVSRQNFIIAAVIVIMAIGILGWQMSENASARTLLGDFRAFYCGGSMVLRGENPYAATPILRCEQIQQPFGLHYARDSVALPAPFPGYALAFYAMFAFLPYLAAVVVWFILLLACTIWGSVMLAKLSGKTEIAIITSLAVGYAVAVIPYGELAPVILCALCGLVLLLRAKTFDVQKQMLAFCALLVLALLPHVALPVFIALFLWMPRMRVLIGCAFVALLGIDLLAGGPAVAISYFMRVLPDHAASEIGFITQFSATWLASAFGLPDRSALLIGKISYGLMVVSGVWLGGMLAMRQKDWAFAVLVPAAFAVVFGPFIHYSEITLALPAAVLLCSRAKGSALIWAMAGVVLIAFPWQFVITQPGLIFLFALSALAISCITLGLSLQIGLRVGLTAAIFCGICIIIAWHFGPMNGLHVGSLPLNPNLAEASWAHHISAKTSSGGIVWWLPKIPTWLGLVAMCLAALSLAREDLELAIPVEDRPVALRAH